MVFREFIEAEDEFDYRKRSLTAVTVNAFLLFAFGALTKNPAAAAVIAGTIVSLVLPLVFAGALWIPYRRFFKCFFVCCVSLSIIGWTICLLRFYSALGDM